MFSTYMPRINTAPTIPRNYIYFAVGVALVVSLLIAIALVASGEVKKAAMRDSALASQRTAAAYCVETQRGAELNSCLKQAWRDVGGDPVQVAATGNASPRTVALSDAAAYARGVPVANGAAQGFMQVSLGAVR